MTGDGDSRNEYRICEKLTENKRKERDMKMIRKWILVKYVVRGSEMN